MAKLTSHLHKVSVRPPPFPVCGGNIARCGVKARKHHLLTALLSVGPTVLLDLPFSFLLVEAAGAVQLLKHALECFEALVSLLGPIHRRVDVERTFELRRQDTVLCEDKEESQVIWARTT
ncbi:hypothetical protein MHYP_G00345110 [Metynnis hypsauchen]